MTWNKPLLIAVVLIALIAFVTTIEIQPPDKFRGTMQATGRIVDCDFGPLNRSPLFFLGLRLSDPKAPYLRINPRKSDKLQFEQLCQRRALVHVTYKAKQRIVGPLRFWIENIDEG